MPMQVDVGLVDEILAGTLPFCAMMSFLGVLVFLLCLCDKFRRPDKAGQKAATIALRGKKGASDVAKAFAAASNPPPPAAAPAPPPEKPKEEPKKSKEPSGTGGLVNQTKIYVIDGEASQYMKKWTEGREPPNYSTNDRSSKPSAPKQNEPEPFSDSIHPAEKSAYDLEKGLDA